MDELPTRFASYREPVVWRAAVELSVSFYEVTREFPASEVYGMTSQIRRSSASIAANVAEGHGRESASSFIQFLRIAQGSLKERETHLIMSERVVSSGVGNGKADGPADEISEMLRSLIRNLQKKGENLLNYSLFATRCPLFS